MQLLKQRCGKSLQTTWIHVFKTWIYVFKTSTEVSIFLTEVSVGVVAVV